FLDQVLEAGLHVLEEPDLPLLGEEQHAVEVLAMTERDAEVPRIERRLPDDLVRQVAHDLLAEEVERDAIGVAPGQVTAELIDVEATGLVEVGHRDGEVEHVPIVTHDASPSPP